ncbi:uncharacterized protein LOC117263461 [Epinephelus lanceolatus]
MDENTPVDSLRLANHRVCSDHFNQEDYLPTKEGLSKFFLKRNAIPKGIPDADRVEGAEGGDSPKESDFAAVPHSTPTKMDERGDDEPPTTGCRLLLTSPQQTMPRMKPSTSGPYLALPPIRAEPVGADGGDTTKESDFATVPHSTPTKMDERGDEPTKTGQRLLLTSPQQTMPHRKPSSSGSYLALPPIRAQPVDLTAPTKNTWTVQTTSNVDVPQTQHGDAAESEAEMSELSMNFGEMDIVDPKDSSYVAPSTSSSSTTGSATRSSQGDGPTGWAEKKWLVNESKLMELFQRCNQCGCVISEKKVTSSCGSEVERVVHQLKDQRFDSRLLQAACRSTLEQDTEPQIAPSVCECVKTE